MTTPDQLWPHKRPAAHKWALFFFVAAAGTNIMLNCMGLFDVLGVIVTVASVAAFFSALFWSRSRRTYTIGTITLGLIFLRSLQTLWYDIIAYRAGLFHAPQRVTLPLIAFAGCVVVLLLLLFRSYTFGAASRQYYGLPAVPDRRQE